MKNLIRIIYLFLFTLIGAFSFLLIHPKEEQKELSIFSSGFGGFCGTESHFTFVSDSINSSIGGKLFKSQCNQCHAKDMKSELTGPALGNSFKHWKKDTLQYLRYLNNSSAFFDTTTNQRLIDLDKRFYPTQSHRFNFSEKEIRSLILFIEDRTYY